MAKLDSVTKIMKGIVLVIFFVLILLLSKYALSATVDLQANPSSGQTPLTTTLTWTSTGLDTCLLDSQAVPVNGSRQEVVYQDKTYGIACTGGKNFTTVTWQAPTTYTDGNTIVATGPRSLGGYEIYYSTNLAQVDTSTPIVINDPAARSYVINGQPNSTYYYKMKAFLVDGTKSDFTNPANNTINFVQASDSVTVDVTDPPLGFVTIATGVYNIVKSNNRFVLVYVGTVPLNTPCDRTQTVNGKYAVPVSSVTWAGTVRPIVVVADCGDR